MTNSLSMGFNSQDYKREDYLNGKGSRVPACGFMTIDPKLEVTYDLYRGKLPPDPIEITLGDWSFDAALNPVAKRQANVPPLQPGRKGYLTGLNQRRWLKWLAALLGLGGIAATS